MMGDGVIPPPPPFPAGCPETEGEGGANQVVWRDGQRCVSPLEVSMAPHTPTHLN